MLINLEEFKNSLDNGLERGYFQTCFPEYLVKTQIAIAERLELILEALKAQGVVKPTSSPDKASEPKQGASGKHSGRGWSNE